MLIAAVFIIAPNWKQPERPSAGEWRHVLIVCATASHFSTIKECAPLLSHSHWWILLIPGSQTQKPTCCEIPFIRCSGKQETVGIEEGIRGCQRVGVRGRVEYRRDKVRQLFCIMIVLMGRWQRISFFFSCRTCFFLIEVVVEWQCCVHLCWFSYTHIILF